MAIFAVIQTRESSTLAEKIRETSHLGVADGVWLVAFAGTANDLSVKLDIDSGRAGGAIVLKVATYSGRTLPTTWDWLKTHWD